MQLLIPFGDRSFRFDDADGADQAGHQMRDGCYETPLPLLMMAVLLRADGGFVDVGANTGVYSVLAAHVNATKPIAAFEPNPPALAALRHNLAINGWSDRVEVHPFALSDGDGQVPLFLPDAAHGQMETSASLEADFQPATGTLEVEVRRLDTVAIPWQVAVIKVDIEGHEHRFLAGARDLIDRDRPIVFVEILAEARRNLLGQFLRHAGYVDFRLRPDLAIHDGETLADPLAWNHAFVPRERLGKFKEAADSAGIAVLRRLLLS